VTSARTKYDLKSTDDETPKKWLSEIDSSKLTGCTMSKASGSRKQGVRCKAG
jgi:hypothetical protein